MHGLGNDFVIVDARGRANPVTPQIAAAIGNRHLGVGFDQLAVILDGIEGANARIEFYNADGSIAGACGNATRCVARILFEEGTASPLTLRTRRGVLSAEALDGGLIRVNMGQPQLDWQEIPLAKEVDTKHLPILGHPGAVGMGNPHLVFAVDNVEGIDLLTLGPEYEEHPLFPYNTNVEFCQVLDRETIRMRVWERGTGVTLACGSGACAAAVALHRKGLTERAITIHLDGGDLLIDWREDGVYMTGGTTHVFTAEFAPEAFQ